MAAAKINFNPFSPNVDETTASDKINDDSAVSTKVRARIAKYLNKEEERIDFNEIPSINKGILNRVRK